MNDDFANVDFRQGLPEYSFIDRKSEVRINIGRASIRNSSSTLEGQPLLGVVSAGMEQDRLDQICNSLKTDAKNAELYLLVTKNDTPFNSQWYLTGDLEKMMQLANHNQLHLPFTNIIFEQIQRAISLIQR